MQLVSKSSGSKGNCHILVGQNEAIMLDCGITNLTFASNYNLVGILVTHSHTDHIRGLKKDNYLGNVKIYGNQRTIDHCTKIQPFQKQVVELGKKYQVGTEFEIVPFEVPHDELNYCYLIYHKPTNKKIVYITDAGNVSHLKFRGINTFIIEANYDYRDYEKIYELAGTKMLNREENAVLTKFKRVTNGQGHLSVQQTIEFLQENVDRETQNIVLVHLSCDKHYENMFTKMVKQKMIRSSINVTAIRNNLAPKELQITNLK